MARRKEYHFSLGNSTRGPIGYCARVVAASKKEAVEILKERLQWAEMGINIQDDFGEEEGEYVEVYLNTEAIKERHIDEWVWLDGGDE